MHNFILASGNQGKARELNELLGRVMQIEAASEKVSVDEDGETFQANALKKAQEYFRFYKRSTVADDSGLVVPALPDILGVHSARFAPECNDYKEKNLKLIEMMKSLEGDERKAYFVCVLCFHLAEDEVYFFEGRLNGSIAARPQGSEGFGYDPIFIPEGSDVWSLAENSQWKSLNSHRAKACAQALTFFHK